MSHLWSRRGVLGAFGGIAAAGAAPNFVRPAKAAGLWDKVKAAGVLRIGIADNIPWSRLNPDGTMTGIAPLTVYAVAKLLGIPKVEGLIATYSDLIPGLNAGRWDMIGASLIITPARCEQVLFTDPFYRDAEMHEWAAYLPGTIKDPPKSFIELARQFDTVGMPSGASVPYMQKAIAAVKSNTRIVQFADQQLMIDGLKAKRVPIATGDIATMHLLKEKIGGFEISPIDSGTPYRGSAGAFRKEDRDARDAFVAAQREFKKTDEIRKIFKEYNYNYNPDAMNISGDEACALKDEEYKL